MHLSLFDLSGKVALVTGSGQGIGKALARGLAQAGALVVLQGRSPDKLAAVAQEFTRADLAVDKCVFDVTDRDAMAAAVKGVLARHGRIDILVNNAGMIHRAPLEKLTPEQWREVIDTDLSAPFFLTQMVVPQMIERRAGKIVNICSLMSEVGRDEVGAYAAAKGGLRMLTRNMATEWGRHNIQVNGIGPGYIETPINAVYRKPGHPLNDYIISRTPAGRWGKPEDLMGTVIFLCAPASDFVNGQLLFVDGGVLATFGDPNGLPRAS